MYRFVCLSLLLLIGLLTAAAPVAPTDPTADPAFGPTTP